jgi:hypothetical protein
MFVKIEADYIIRKTSSNGKGGGQMEGGLGDSHPL